MQPIVKGETVTLYQKTQVGTDDFNRPIYEEIPTEVNNVFVGVPTTEQITNELNLSGKRLSHILGIPKGDTHEWTDVVVEFHGRKWKTFGYPIKGTTDLMPLSWDMNVNVEVYG